MGGEGAADGEMAGWHQQLNGYEFEQTPRDGEGPGSLVCCRPWGHKESDMSEGLNNTSETDGQEDNSTVLEK